MRPLVTIEQTQEIYIHTDTHTLELQMDMEAIDNNLRDIQRIIETGLEHLEENYKENDTQPFARIEQEIQGYEINIPEEGRTGKFFRTVLGKIKIQLATTLVDLREIQTNFDSFIRMQFPGQRIWDNSNRTKQGENKDKLIEHTIFKSIITMIDKQLDNASHVDNAVRKKRDIDPTQLILDDLPEHLGVAMNNIGLKYEENSWKISKILDISQNLEISQGSIANLFHFTGILANTVNRTVKYLRESEIINTKLIMAVFKTAEQAIQTEEDIESTEKVDDYLLNLIRLHFATVETHRHIENVKKVISSSNDRLSSYVLQPNELQQYLQEFETYSGYKTEVDFNKHMNVYYKMLKATKTLSDNILTHTIEIPIRAQETKARTFSRINIMKTPFHLEDRKVLLGEDFPTQIIYDTENKEFFDMKVCSEEADILLCKPQTYEKSICLNSLVENDSWQTNCSFLEFMKEEYIEKLLEDSFAYVPKKDTSMVCTCSNESIDNNRVKIVWKEETWGIKNEINIIQIPTNCDCKLDQHHIPRRIKIQNKGKLEWHIQNNYNISDLNFELNIQLRNESDLIIYINHIRTSFENLKKNTQ